MSETPRYEINIKAGVPEAKFFREKWTEVPGVLPGTVCNPFPMQFVMSGGGMGDYINYTSALLWLVENCPWIHGEVFYPEFMIDFGHAVFSGIKHWKVFERNEIFENRTSGMKKFVLAPDFNEQSQYINAMGSNLIELGGMYFAQRTGMQHDMYLPRTEPSRALLPKELQKETKRWVVFTPGATSEARTVPGSYWNPIIDHTLQRQMLPVFIGRSDLTGKYKASFAPGIREDGCINLINKTTCMEAAAIMKYAACVIGLDNGLLHLAATTDANIVFGYNVTTVEHREPSRPPGEGRHINLIPTREEVPCISCQSRIKMLYPHLFRFCLYDKERYPQEHLACLRVLFANEGKLWRDAIDELTKEKV